MNTFLNAQVTVTEGKGKTLEVYCRAMVIDVKHPSENHPPCIAEHNIVMTAHGCEFYYPDSKPGEEWYTGDGVYRVLYRPTWKNRRSPYIVQRKSSCGCEYVTVTRCWSLDRVHVFIRNHISIVKIYSLEG